MTRKEKGKRERKKKEITKNCLPLFSDMVIPKMFRCQMQALLFRHIINVTALILKRFYSNSRFFLWQNIERIGYFLLYALVFFHTSRFKVDPGTTQTLSNQKAENDLASSRLICSFMQLNFKPKNLCNLINGIFKKCFPA